MSKYTGKTKRGERCTDWENTPVNDSGWIKDAQETERRKKERDDRAWQDALRRANHESDS